jgi:type I restriction enzyme, R subunit
VEAGGVVFTTIQKFFPEEKGDRHPCSRSGATSSSSPTRRTAASTTSSTASPGTCATPCPTPRSSASPARPSSCTDANTRAVFGDYISVYDIQRAVEDGATVPIYYESRLAKLELDEAERPKIDPEFEEATEGEEVERKEKLKTKWAQLEAMVGLEKRHRAGGRTSSSTSRSGWRRWTARRWSSA